MPSVLQHVLVIALVAVCAAFVLWQSMRTLRGRGGKVGSCCAKGCTEVQPAGKTRPAPNRIVFLPADSLKPRR